MEFELVVTNSIIVMVLLIVALTGFFYARRNNITVSEVIWLLLFLYKLKKQIKMSKAIVKATALDTHSYTCEIKAPLLGFHMEYRWVQGEITVENLNFPAGAHNVIRLGHITQLAKLIAGGVHSKRVES